MTKDDELRQEASRGERVKALLQSPCWQQDVMPYIQKMCSKLGVGALWKPTDSASVDMVALGCAFNGGRDEGLKDINSKLNIWIEQGEVASKKLEQGAKTQK